MLARQRIGRAVNRFLQKAQRDNHPFQAQIKTEQYIRFHAMIKNGILKQAKAAAALLRDNPSDKLITDDLSPMTPTQVSALQHYLINHVPRLSEFVSKDRVAAYLKFAFEQSVKAQYKRWGYTVKADDIQFELTNDQYLAALNSDADYLLNRSKLDETTIQRMISLIQEGKQSALTIDEVAGMLTDEFDPISESRAFVISRTETANAMGQGNLATMQENGVQTKHWVTAGSNPCPECEDNEADGSIPVDDAFSSGDDAEPAHPNCECYTEADEINLDAIDIWSGE